MPPQDLPERRPRRRNSSMSIVVGVVILVVVVGAGYFAWKALSNKAPTPAPVTTPTVPVNTDQTYASTTWMSVTYPQGWTLNDSYANTSVNPNKPINGVKLTIPAAMATGTNLSSDSGVSIEQLPRAKACSGDIYLAANVHPKKVTENGVDYSVASSSDAGAGNLYEEIIYAVSSSSPCTAVRYFIHSTQFANYPAGTVTQFDKAALLAAFDKIRQSLVLQ